MAIAFVASARHCINSAARSATGREPSFRKRWPCQIKQRNEWHWILPKKKKRELPRTVRRHCLHDQVIAKAWSDVRLFQQIEALAPDLPYLAMNREQDTSTELVKSMKIRYLGTEVMFSDENSPLCKQSYVKRVHAMGYLVWCNTIVFDPEVVFAAGHNDETASLGRPEQAWGWLANLEYDIMQTDCAGEAVRYLKETGKKYRAQGMEKFYAQ